MFFFFSNIFPTKIGAVISLNRMRYQTLFYYKKTRAGHMLNSHATTKHLKIMACTKKKKKSQRQSDPSADFSLTAFAAIVLKTYMTFHSISNIPKSSI